VVAVRLERVTLQNWRNHQTTEIALDQRDVAKIAADEARAP